MTPTDIAKFLMNEVQGVCNKRKVDWDFFPSDFLIAVLTLRKAGEINNMVARQYLNDFIDRYSD